MVAAPRITATSADLTTTELWDKDSLKYMSGLTVAWLLPLPAGEGLWIVGGELFKQANT